MKVECGGRTIEATAVYTYANGPQIIICPPRVGPDGAEKERAATHKRLMEVCNQIIRSHSAAIARGELTQEDIDRRIAESRAAREKVLDRFGALTVERGEEGDRHA